jgi:hypothetical protein
VICVSFMAYILADVLHKSNNIVFVFNFVTNRWHDSVVLETQPTAL